MRTYHEPCFYARQQCASFVHIKKCRELRTVHEHTKTYLHSAHVSLCVRPKNRRISVCSEQYVNHPQMVQRRFAVPSTHTCIWFANRLRAICEPFGALVYTRLYVPYWHYLVRRHPGTTWPLVLYLHLRHQLALRWLKIEQFGNNI